MIDRKRLFTAIRGLDGRLSASQVRGVDAILDVWEGNAIRGLTDRRWLAYALATAWHETANTMMPVHEYGGRAYFFRMYDPGSPLPNRAAMARRMGQLPGDGVLFPGRGYVQLTWRSNYQRMGDLFKIDLTSSKAAADRAMNPDIAARIMFVGMRDGLFTGHALARYLSGTTQDWVGARRIINGTDRAEDIAGYAVAIWGGLS